MHIHFIVHQVFINSIANVYSVKTYVTKSGIKSVKEEIFKNASISSNIAFNHYLHVLSARSLTLAFARLYK